MAIGGGTGSCFVYEPGQEVFVIIDANSFNVIKGIVQKAICSEYQDENQQIITESKYYVQYSNSDLNTTTTRLFNSEQLYSSWTEVENVLRQKCDEKINELYNKLVNNSDGNV